MSWFAQNRPTATAAQSTPTPQGPTSTTQPGSTAPAGGGDLDAKLMAILSKYGPATPANLERASAELQAAGFQVHRNAEGVAGKVTYPGGEIVDVIHGAGAGGGGDWQTLHAAPGGSIGGMSGVTGGQSPSDIIKGTPGFQFRFDEGLDALQRSAAAKGDLLTGGTLKDIVGYGQNFASNEFQNQWNRDMQLANMGYGAAGNIGTFGSEYGNNVMSTIGQIGKDAASGSNAQGNIWGNVAGQVGTAATNWWNKKQAGQSPTAPTPPAGSGSSDGSTGTA